MLNNDAFILLLYFTVDNTFFNRSQSKVLSTHLYLYDWKSNPIGTFERSFYNFISTFLRRITKIPMKVDGI